MAYVYGPSLEALNESGWKCIPEHVVANDLNGEELYYTSCPGRMTCENITSFGETCVCNSVDLPKKHHKWEGDCWPACDCLSSDSFKPFLMCSINICFASYCLYWSCWIVYRLKSLKEFR